MNVFLKQRPRAEVWYCPNDHFHESDLRFEFRNALIGLTFKHEKIGRDWLYIIALKVGKRTFVRPHPDFVWDVLEQMLGVVVAFRKVECDDCLEAKRELEALIAEAI